jgi:Fe-S-cluster containining protein
MDSHLGDKPGKVRALSIHADYRCRHSGVCCTLHWDVPMALPVYRSLKEAVAAGRLKPSPEAAGLDPFVINPDLPEDEAAIFERVDSGACVFFDGESRLCLVHRDLGEDAMATTCRTFPRLAVQDARGTFITLSHFCPTAASQLFREDVALAIVEGPGAFPPADYDGLTVTDDDLPPLLKPDVLMDAEGYTAWERHMVAVCAGAESAESALATLTRDAAVLRTWTGGGDPLHAAVARLPQDGVPAAPPSALDASLQAHAEAMSCVPDDLKPEPDDDGLGEAYARFVREPWPAFSRVLRNYAAAKAFASWTAYQGRGVASIVRGLEAALALVRVEAARQCRDAGAPLDADRLKEAIRQADFILNHLAAGDALAEAWSSAENAAITGP